MAHEPGKIRNVAVVGHRGTGKTSLVEAMLFQAGATNRLGTIEAGSTVSDWDEDEQRRNMSLAASVCHAEWQDRKINLIDTPGDAGFVGDAIAAIRVVEGTLFVVSGVMGVEVQTARNWTRAEGLELARKYDDEFPSTFFEENLEYLALSRAGFEDIVDQHRNREIWEQGGNGWCLRHQPR